MTLASLSAWSLLIAGGFQLLIGLLTPIFGFPVGIVGLSSRTDQQMWGDSSQHLLENRTVRDLRTHHTIVIGALLCGLGSLQALVAWFAWRPGETWALGALTVMGLLMMPWWVAMVLEFTRAGVPVSLWDLQPFVYVHAAFWLVGTALGWIAVLSRPGTPT